MPRSHIPPPPHANVALTAASFSRYSIRMVTPVCGKIGKANVAAIIETLDDADAVIVVPPFTRLEYPSLAAHLLQSIAERDGLRVRVLYANLVWAQMIGEDVYEAICRGAPYSQLSGERIFSRAAFGSAPLEGDRCLDAGSLKWEPGWPTPAELEAAAIEWADAVATAILAHSIPVVGATNTFEQTCPSLAVLSRVKARASERVIILGGGNCEGPMADGLLSLNSPVDHIFRGESEETFPAFLTKTLHDKGDMELGPVIEGKPCHDLDALPTPNFQEFFDQHPKLLPDREGGPETLWLNYESSRGCWWGQKHHCTFCGFNGLGMQFREKSPERVLDEIRALTERSPTRRVCMADNIMPHRYYRSLLPHLIEADLGLEIYYEQKANISLERILSLRAAGVTVIQAGVESLSTPLLELMDKGVTGPQNLDVLRYARAAGLQISWSILYGFPGDRAEWFEQMARLLPLIRHLEPPTGVHRLTIDRFSPYFDRPAEYGVANVRPFDGYQRAFPASANLSDLAYHFDGDYESGSLAHREVITAIEKEVELWCAAQRDTMPVLQIERLTPNAFSLVDRRGLPGRPEYSALSFDLARACLTSSCDPASPAARWAVEQQLAVELDHRHVPLALASPALMAELADGDGLQPRERTVQSSLSSSTA